MVMFSPPYWGLRKYFACECASRVSGLQDTQRQKESGSSLSFRVHAPDPNCPRCKGTGIKEGSEKEIGVESTWHDFIANMLKVCEAIWRVLKDDGSLFIVIGDVYIGGHQTMGKPAWWQDLHSSKHQVYNQDAPTATSVGHCIVCRRKMKLLLPHRLALSLVDAGWWVRHDIPWMKKNPNPTSAKDKWKPAHEYILHFVKKEIYYFDQKAILIEASSATYKRIKQPTLMEQFSVAPKSGSYPVTGPDRSSGNVLKRYAGKYLNTNPEMVNSARARQTRPGYDADAHYYTEHEGKVMAVPPDFMILEADEEDDGPELPPILSSVSTYQKGLCKPCNMLFGKNEAHYRVRTPKEIIDFKLREDARKYIGELKKAGELQIQTSQLCPRCESLLVHHYAVYPEAIVEPLVKACCPIGGIVVDPMCGTGTTLVVAKKLGRHYIGIDLNPDSVTTSTLRLAEILG